MKKLNKFVVIFLFSVSAQSHSNQIWNGKSGYIEFADGSKSCESNSSSKGVTEPGADHRLTSIFSMLTVSADKDKNSYFVKSSEHENNPVFSESESNLLGNKVALCSELLQQGKKINFSLSGLKRSLIGSSYLTSTGTISIENDRLNIIFGHILVDKKRKYIRSSGSMAHGRYPDDRELMGFKLPVGNDEHSFEEKWMLNLFPGAKHVNQRNDWISIDLTRSYEREKLFKSPNDHASSSELKAEPYAESVKAKLEKLKEMHDQGLVPETIYLEEVRVILKGM
ncbi:MAG: hypothetical protein K6L74_04860 [Neptuniibacter sp.]